ncbi:MAG TPA: site-specific DNA-methyltransferase [Candidatus Marinimicrobia bacterium]|nr:site-specific DNA-methyltransferase [Candidatus Neomarinimicrobiota bacterium]
MDGKSLNVVEEKLNDLKKILPEVFTEEKVDWEKLKAALGEDIEFREERYHLNWAGKSEAFRALQTPTTATLVPDKNESVNFDNTENLFIEGENLEVLKVLQKSYFGKIKMIYIDPPYNTGNDFIYSDKFAESREDYLKRSGTKDENGLITREGLFRNSKDSGHYHSNWLSMMYPRLFLARNLLREDGVIFVSIDDNEVHNLRMLMNEVFGEENFIVSIIWKKRSTPPNDQIIGADHEYLAVYAKSIESVALNLKERSAEQISRYNNPDNHPKGPWTPGDLMANVKGGRYVKSLYYPIVNPKTGESHYPSSNGNWRFNSEKIQELLNNNEIYFGDNGKGRPKLKRFLCDVKSGITYNTIWNFVPFNTKGSQEMTDLLGNLTIFDNPKPSGLIFELVKLGSEKDSIILDFFSGSSTTAHAVLDLNKQDGGKRKFIMVQMPEPCGEDSEACKAGFKTIAEIGKERIRQVIKKIKAEDEGKFDFAKSGLDLGFKVFKLRQSNFKIWRGDKIESEEELLRQMEAHADPVAKEAKIEDILYELLLKSGKELTSEIEYKDGIFWINKNEMAIVLEKIDEDVVKTVINGKPGKLITLDRLFQNNDQFKTNTLLQMKDAEIEMSVV